MLKCGQTTRSSGSYSINFPGPDSLMMSTEYPQDTVTSQEEVNYQAAVSMQRLHTLALTEALRWAGLKQYQD